MTDDQLSKLQGDYPGMRFGTVWASAGRRRRRFWARRLVDGALLTSWSVEALRERIEMESSPACQPFTSLVSRADPVEGLVRHSGPPPKTSTDLASGAPGTEILACLNEPQLAGLDETATQDPSAWQSRSFPGRVDQISVARSFLNKVMQGFARADDATLCLSELAANAVVHSASGHPGKQFTVSIKVYPDYLRVEVLDDGGPWTPRRDPPDQCGHGLLIVDRLASRWGIEADDRACRTVWFEMDGDPAESSGDRHPEADLVCLGAHRPASGQGERD